MSARLDELAQRWSLAIRDDGPGPSEQLDVVLDAFTQHLVRFLPWMLGPYRETVEPLWVKSSELFGSVAARRGLAAGEVIEEFQLLRELVIRDLYKDPPMGGRLPLSLREVLRLNRGIDRGVTHASVGHTDALFFQFFEGEGAAPSDPIDLADEVAGSAGEHVPGARRGGRSRAGQGGPGLSPGGSRAERSLEGDLPPEELRRLAREVSDWMADYLASVEDFPVLSRVEPGAVRSALPPSGPDRGESMDRVLADFRDTILPGITHWNHPGFFGYFSITGSGPGILGEMIAAALNVNAMVWRSSPAATELEEVVADWLRQWMGLPEDFDGVINDTASSSTLHALAAAREVAYPEARSQGMFDLPRGRIYASEHAHSSVEKAVITLGFGREGYRAVPADGEYRMDPEGLRAAVRRDVEKGIRPVAVVATTGTTSTSSVDPVEPIADIAEEHGLWLHVDAAYGGPASMVPELRSLFRGWERADSVVVNPHKWLFTPVDCSLLYCRRPADLVRAFSLVPEYLRSKNVDEVRNLMDYGVALGRRFRALKLWFVMRWFGRDGIVVRLRAHVEMARSFAARVDAAEGWERMAPVPLATVAFRRVPEGLDPEAVDALNHRILERVNESGEVFLTHTALEGRVALRLAVGNVRTRPEHVARAWTLLEAAASQG